MGKTGLFAYIVIFYQINSQCSLETETSELTFSPPVATKLPPFSLTEEASLGPQSMYLSFQPAEKICTCYWLIPQPLMGLHSIDWLNWLRNISSPKSPEDTFFPPTKFQGYSTEVTIRNKKGGFSTEVFNIQRLSIKRVFFSHKIKITFISKSQVEVSLRL